MTPDSGRFVLRFSAQSHKRASEVIGGRTLTSFFPVTFLQPHPDAPQPSETAVIVPMPAMEPLVEPHRRHLDRAAAWGVPAHVTVLYPFIEPAGIDDHVLAAGVACVCARRSCPAHRGYSGD
jgi:hypothetical protein